jgi:hypothetical protein
MYTTRDRLRLHVLAAVAALVLVAAGCGSDDDGGGGAAATADESAAAELTQQFSTRPTEITQSKPIEGEIPSGKNITFISCGVEACAVQGPILEEAASKLG